eukprot:7424497-Lingulodinium_polyedra.AAC.1
MGGPARHRAPAVAARMASPVGAWPRPRGRHGSRPRAGRHDAARYRNGAERGLRRGAHGPGQGPRRVD